MALQTSLCPALCLELVEILLGDVAALALTRLSDLGPVEVR
jgi:hypothetical protein